MTSKLFIFTIATTIMLIIIRFFSRIFSPIGNIFKLIIRFNILLLHKLYVRQYKLISLMLYAFLAIISYIFLYDLNSIKVIKIFIFTLISFAVSMYISDNYTLSKNIFIKNLQKLVFIIIIKFALIVLILILFQILLW